MQLNVVQPTPTYAPVKHLMVYVDLQCPLRCSYCFVDKHSRRMESATAREAVDFLYDRRISGAERKVEITWFGGEPFLAVDVISDAIAYSRRPRPNCYKKFGFAATTSGVLAGPQVERVVRETQMQLLISVDGDPAASGERRFSSGRSSYATVARNLPRLVSWAGRAIVRATFHPKALDLVANVRHVLELGAPSVALCPVVEADWSGCEERLREAFLALAEWFVQEFRAGRVPPLDVTWMMLRQRATPGCCGGARPERPCNVGRSLLAVGVDGTVYPCHRFTSADRKLGHVRDRELAPQRNQYVALSSRDILGCDTCEAERVCGGGCRAVAVQGGYGLHGKHPSHCLVTRAQARATLHIQNELSSDPRFHAELRRPSLAASVLSELALTGG